MLTKSPPPQREATTLILDRKIIADAKDLAIDVSQVAEAAISAAVRAEKERRWKEENREALESSNEWVRKNGLPLADLRKF